MRLFFAPGCPFAHRTRALLTHLQQPFEGREIDLKAKPAEFLQLSPTGRVPLLEDGGFVLYESAVINEYLAERLGWAGLSADVKERARERLAMVQFDHVLNDAFYAAFRSPVTELPPGAVREVDELARTVRGKPAASLLGLHVAPFWLRWNWLAEDVPLVSRIRAASDLSAWLDEAVALPAVQRTAPDRTETVRQMRERLGLPPS